MKDKQEQIEEIAKYICNACEMGFDIDGDCAEGNNYKTCGISKETAEYIYNAGYRKTFTSDLASDMQKAFKEGYEKGCETCGQAWDNGYNDGYESGKEDGVKEFAERLKEKFDEQKHFYETASISHRDISLTALYTAYKYLDETLKEYEK